MPKHHTSRAPRTVNARSQAWIPEEDAVQREDSMLTRALLAARQLTEQTPFNGSERGYWDLELMPFEMHKFLVDIVTKMFAAVPADTPIKKECLRAVTAIKPKIRNLCVFNLQRLLIELS